MLHRDLIKHAGEFLRYLRNRQYEQTPTGILFARAGAFAQGRYTHDINGEDVRTDANNLPDEGLKYLLSVGVCAGTQLTAWYLALYGSAYTPTTSLTGASFPATAGEITSGTEGYTQGTRPVWTPPGTVTTTTVNNSASKAAYTIATASVLVINGAAMLSNATKGDTTGKIISATKFSAARNAYNTDTFNLEYDVTLTTS
jgi:hypothetical protein